LLQAKRIALHFFRNTGQTHPVAEQGYQLVGVIDQEQTEWLESLPKWAIGLAASSAFRAFSVEPSAL
jgi:hypothetical protein